MDRIPTLTTRDRILFYLLHIVLIGPPFYFVFISLYHVPQYIIILLSPDSLQPIGWIFMFLTILDYAVMAFLAINSIQNIEKRPQSRSIIVMILIIFLVVITFLMILLLPAILILLKLLLTIFLR
jgi:hypothetical protein